MCKQKDLSDIDRIPLFEKVNVLEKLKNANIIAIFGAGNGGKYLKKVLDTINIKIYCFYDNDKRKWGNSIDGINILPPSDSVSLDSNNSLICIASEWAADIAKQLRENGIKNYVDLTCWDDRWKKNFDSQKILTNLKDLKKTYELFEDDESKKVFLSVIKYRLSKDPFHLHKSSYKPYFHPSVKPEVNDTIIDAGAWNGDTAIQFCDYLKNKCTIFSFEPENDNYQLLLKNIDERGIKKQCNPLKMGLWNKNTFLCFDDRAHVSSQFHITDKGNQRIKTVSLDSFVRQKKIVPDLIKMDIEGAELKAIEGAKETIKTYKPKLQICVYHEPDDLWQIPLTIKKINHSYKFYLGHHTQTLFETTLYAKNLE